METNEIVMILRGQKGDPDFNFYARGDIAPLITSATLNAAADLLESQQARITALEAQLAESQRRERAAVKDIEKMMRICEKGSCHFCANGDCTESPYCSPKWRGPQAGEGNHAE